MKHLKTEKVDTSTIARTIVLFIALFNQILNMLGMVPLELEENTIYDLASLIALVGSAIWNWWKNNSFSQQAIEADKYMNDLKNPKRPSGQSEMTKDDFNGWSD